MDKQGKHGHILIKVHVAVGPAVLAGMVCSVAS
jgi:hypothetical protein